jgi:Periplasmic component of the Tol biopolymer transport system
MIVSRCPRRWPTALLLASSLLMAAPVWAEAPPSLATQAQSGYQLPSAALKAIVDAPRAPSLFLSPRRDLAVQMGTPSLPSIAQVAQPELKLAGLRIHPRTYSESRFSFGNSLGLKSVADASERPIKGLPQDLAVASLAWSPDQRFLAFNHVDAANGGNELWLVDIASASARRLLGGLNTVLDDGYQWLPDSSGLLVQLQPEGRTPPPESTVPTGPAIQQTGATGEVRAIRTYQDLLANENDAAALTTTPPCSRHWCRWAGRCSASPSRHLPRPVAVAGRQVPAQPARAAPVFLPGAGVRLPARDRGARPQRQAGPPPGQPAAGRRPADRQRRGADRPAFGQLAR